MRLKLATLLVMAGAIIAGGCGGGGGGGGGSGGGNIRVDPLIPETPPGNGGGMVNPGPATPVTPTPKDPNRGSLTAPGIDRIPLSAIQASKSQIADMYAILEATPDGHSHSYGVRWVACNSYISSCTDPQGSDVPFTVHNTEYEGDAIQFLLPDVAASTRLVSISTRPVNGIVGDNGAGLPFVVVQGTGNDLREDFFGPDDDFEGDPALALQKRNILAAVAANKVLYVGGYGITDDGEYVRSGSSTGCTGVESGCLYAPFEFNLPGGIGGFGGTSASAPNVASALASVLAVFPDTEGTELVRLAKACAIRESTLSGLGRANFNCMTVLDENGQWRVMTQDELDNFLTTGSVPTGCAPADMRLMVFPGRTSVSGEFGRAGSEETIRLGLTHMGTFDYAAGVPTYNDEDGAVGFFPVIAGDERNNVIGLGYTWESGLFSRATFGQRDEFFGLGRRHGYQGGIALDADIGHKNVYARFSYRESEGGRLIDEAKGSAFGFTAREEFAVDEDMNVSLAANVDKFIGGSADTAFGPVTMESSSWNRQLESKLRYTPDEHSELSVKGSMHWYGSGHEDVRVTANYQLEF